MKQSVAVVASIVGAFAIAGVLAFLAAEGVVSFWGAMGIAAVIWVAFMVFFLPKQKERGKR